MQDIYGRAGGTGQRANFRFGKHQVLEHAFGEEEAVGVQGGGVGTDFVVEAGAHLSQVGSDGTPVKRFLAAGAASLRFTRVVVSHGNSRFVQVQTHLFRVETQDLHVEGGSGLERFQAQQRTLVAHPVDAVQPPPDVQVGAVHESQRVQVLQLGLLRLAVCLFVVELAEDAQRRFLLGAER